MALLATVVVVLLVLVAVGLSMISSGIFEGFMSESQSVSNEAYISAESGVKDALMRLARNKGYSSSGYYLPAGCTLNGASACARVIVEIYGATSACSQSISSGQDCVIATGTLGGKTRKIETILNVNAANGKITTASRREI